MRAIRLQYSVSHEAFFVARIPYHYPPSASNRSSQQTYTATRLRFAAELATASRGIVGALNKKADAWRR
jgi:hypothetical protein